jgi:hypothetical protein
MNNPLSGKVVFNSDASELIQRDQKAAEFVTNIINDNFKYIKPTEFLACVVWKNKFHVIIRYYNNSNEDIIGTYTIKYPLTI